MIRCPDQYYCQRSGDCKGISTCNIGRGGTLCGRCVGNTTESLFSANCFQMDNCYTVLFGMLYTGCVVMYSIFLAIFNDVKKELISRATNLIRKMRHAVTSRDKTKSFDVISGQVDRTDSYSSLVEALLLDDSPCNYGSDTKTKMMKDDGVVSDVLKYSRLVEALLLDSSHQHRKLHHNKKISNMDIEKTDVEVESKEDKSDADSGMKFMQIFLYYVQDATLFKIHLPDANEPSEIFLVKILQFSS